MTDYGVVVIGGGPAGLAAAVSAKKHGATTLLIERESRLGGILKQCVHDGFGVVRYGEKLSGPEYAERHIDEFNEADIDSLTLAFVTRIEKTDGGFTLDVVTRDGIRTFTARALVLATGCRERTGKQAGIHGTRPAGVFTAGTAQRLVNIDGVMPAKRCVILGSGDIGLIMARRLTLEGASVEGVYEVKSTPSGLSRNIRQCLEDFDIPLHLSTTVTRAFGDARLEGVEVSSVDDRMTPIPGTGRHIPCDTLILSVGLIPENELAESLGVTLSPASKGPACDQSLMTDVPGVFSCGNALHVNDLADYVSESGETAGKSAALYEAKERRYTELKPGAGLLYAVPSRLDLKGELSAVTCYFRSARVVRDVRFVIKNGDATLFEKRYGVLRPPEMERITADLSALDPAQPLEAYIEKLQLLDDPAGNPQNAKP